MRRRMLAGELYLADDPVLAAEAARAHDLQERYNATRHDEPELRDSLLRELLGEVGEGVVVRPPFRCDYGRHISIGRNTFVNVNCVFADNNLITIGDDTLIGPAVQIYTASHPLSPDERITPPGSAAPYVTTSKPVTIGDKCWIGGGAILLPGVTIGDGSTIGAGSVVTRSVPPRSVAAGNPCRILKTLP